MLGNVTRNHIAIGTHSFVYGVGSTFLLILSLWAVTLTDSSSSPLVEKVNTRITLKVRGTETSHTTVVTKFAKLCVIGVEGARSCVRRPGACIDSSRIRRTCVVVSAIA